MLSVSTDLTDLRGHPGEPILEWSTGRSQTTTTWVSVGPHSWLDFVQHLNPSHPASVKEVRPYVGGTLTDGKRTARTVEKRHLLTLDADYADADFLLDVADVLESPYLFHTTWRHTPDTPRYRLIIPLDRAVSPSEYKELAWLVMNRLGGSYFDKTTAQPERFMWGPSTQSREDYLWGHYQQALPYLAVNEWLSGAHSPAGGSETPGVGTSTPNPSETVTGPPSGPLEFTEEDTERALEILADACDAVEFVYERDEFAGRNEAVFNKLPLLFRFALAGVIDPDIVTERLWEASQRVDAEESYRREEFNASVRSAWMYAKEDGPVLPETTATKMALSDFEAVSTQEDLWSASPQLRHIAQAADSLGRNRMALLAAVIIRVLASVDAGICLAGAQDGSVGSRAALNLGVALVGSSGQGKSTIQEQSGQLVPTPGIESKPSTGQGLIQEYLTWDEAEQKHNLVLEPRRLFFFDEVDTLSASAADKTSTLMSEIRTMLTGGATGTANATAQRKRFLPARSYNFQMMLNVQPSRAGQLLQDRDAGTPQRFIWVTVTDPNRAVHPKDRPPWPGPLDWDDSFLLEFELGNREFVDIPDWLKDELLDYDYKVSLEGMEGGEVSWAAHRNLLRLKVACGIAFLHQSPEILTEHVGLADIILEDSLRVQRECEKLIRQTALSDKVSRARVDDKVLELVGDEKLDRLVRNAKNILSNTEGWVKWGKLRPAYRDRDAWAEPVWETLTKDPEVETREQGRTREARWAADDLV